MALIIHQALISPEGKLICAIKMQGKNGYADWVGMTEENVFIFENFRT